MFKTFSRELERHAHGIAIVVVADVFAPIDQRRIEILRMGKVPLIDIDHAIAAIDFDNGSDQRDDAVADFADVWAFIDRQAIGKFHQRGGRAGFGRVDRAGDVIDGNGFGDEFVGFGVIELDGARDRQASPGAGDFVEIFQVGFRRDGHGNHFAAFLGGADGENFHARRGLLEQAHVLVDVFGVGKDSRSAGDVAEDNFRSRNGLLAGR